jgi:hypothetical protein
MVRSVRSKRFWLCAVLLAGMWMSPSMAQQSWITFDFGGRFSDEEAALLTSWINDTCRPDEMGYIAGFSYQAAPGKPVNLKAYCRDGGSGKLGKVKVVRIAYPDGFPLDPLRPLTASTERVVILGFDVTRIDNDLMKPPTGTVVMVVKE